MVSFRLLLCCFWFSFNAQAINEKISIAYGLENYNFSNLFQRFTRETGIAIDDAAFKNNELKAELIQRSSNDLLPDVVIVPSDFIGLKEIGYSEIPEILISAQLTQRAKRSAKIANRYFGVPIIMGNNLLLYYNKGLLSEPADSWQQMLQQKPILPSGVELISWSYHEMYWFIPFLGVFQEYPFVNGKINFMTDGMKKALFWYHSLAEKGIVDKDCDYQCSVSKFINGKAAYTINGTWAFTQFNDALGDKLGVALLPSYQGQRMRSYFSSHVIAFPANSLNGKRRQALEKFVSFFQRKDIQLLMWQEMYTIPTHKRVLEKLAVNAKQYTQVMLAQLELSEPLPNDYQMAIVWEAMLKGVNRYHAGIFDADKATEYMDYIANKSIQNAEK